MPLLRACYYASAFSSGGVMRKKKESGKQIRGSYFFFMAIFFFPDPKAVGSGKKIVHIRAGGRAGGLKQSSPHEQSSRIPNLSSLPSRAIQPTSAKAMAAFGGHCLRARADGRALISNGWCYSGGRAALTGGRAVGRAGGSLISHCGCYSGGRAVGRAA